MPHSSSLLIALGLSSAIFISTAKADTFSSLKDAIGNTRAQMIYSSSQSGDLSLFRYTPQNSQHSMIVKAAVSGRGEYEPSVSPDGKQVAFTTYRYGGWKVAIANIDGSHIRRLTLDPHYAYDPSWSPDGKHIMYRRIVPNGSAYFRGQADIFKINLDGSNNTNMSKSRQSWERKPTYAPDGSTVLFDSWTEEGGESFGLTLMNPVTRQQKPIQSDSKAIFAPSWSPDGKWIAHLRQDEEGFVDVWIMDKTGAQAKNLTLSQRRGFKPTGDKIRHWQTDTNWSPDGKFISFVANYADQDNIDIYVISPDGKHLARVTTHMGDDIHPYWFFPAD